MVQHTQTATLKIVPLRATLYCTKQNRIIQISCTFLWMDTYVRWYVWWNLTAKSFSEGD